MHSQPTQSFGVSFSLSLSLIDSRRQVPSIHSTIMKLKSDKLPSQQKGGCELDHIKNVEHWVKQIVSFFAALVDLLLLYARGPLSLACFAPLLSVLMTKAASWQQDLLHSLSARTAKWQMSSGLTRVFQICR